MATSSLPNTVNPGNSSESQELRRTDPDACLFVASLNASRTSEQLDDSVRQRFQKYGKLASVKVMRDWQNRPYAFVQYYRSSDADLALRKCQGALLDGRPLRIEKAHVNRTLRVIPLNIEQEVQALEIEENMKHFGSIDSVSASDESGGWLVKYRHREDAIAAYHTLKIDENWSIEWSVPLSQQGGKSVAVPPVIVKSKEISAAQDELTVFVGNLNAEKVTTELLKSKFSECGEVEDFSLFSKAHKANMYAYALIQFKDPASVQRAIEMLNGTEWLGTTIKVAPKEPQGFMRRARRHTVPSQSFRSRSTSFTTQQQYAYWVSQPAIVPVAPGVEVAHTKEIVEKQEETHVSIQTANQVIEKKEESSAPPVSAVPPLQLPQMPMFYPMPFEGQPQQQQGPPQQFIYVPVQYSPPSPSGSPDQQPRQQFFMAYPAPQMSQMAASPASMKQQQGYNVGQQSPMPMGMYYPPANTMSPPYGVPTYNYMTPTGQYYADQAMAQTQTPFYAPEEGQEMVQFGFGDFPPLPQQHIQTNSQGYPGK